MTGLHVVNGFFFSITSKFNVFCKVSWQEVCIESDINIIIARSLVDLSKAVVVQDLVLSWSHAT